MDEHPLDAQRQHWERTFSDDPDMFGEQPSYPAKEAVEVFRHEGKTRILELGGGQGRDTLFFAKNGFRVYVLDYSEEAIKAITRRAESLGISERVTALCHDIRKPLPFGDESFDACYSHMLYCMALTTSQLQHLCSEVKRVLRPGGLNIYTARNTSDSHYGTGIHRGEDMYEVSGFIVHFFSKEKVERLASGYEIVGIDKFEEGALPRKLFLVILRKESDGL